MVDLLAHSRNLTVGSELTDDVLVVLALPECHGLVDWLVGIGNDVLQLQWTELVPFLLSGLQSDAMRLFVRMSIVVVVVKNLDWSFGMLLTRAAERSVHLLSWVVLSTVNSTSGLGTRLHWNLPEVKLLEEMDLIVLIHEFREYSSIVSQVVDKVLECLTVSIQEHSVINFLELMHSIEHFLKG